MLTLFIVSSIILVAFVLYCDCPYSEHQDLKFIGFYVAVVHLGLALLTCQQLVSCGLIGLLSFRLIGHYLNRPSANRGASNAVTFNRLGDILVLISAVKFITLVHSILADTLELELLTLAICFKSILICTYV